MEREDEEDQEERRKQPRYIMRTTEEFADWFHKAPDEEVAQKLRKSADNEYARLMNHLDAPCVVFGCKERLRRLVG